MFHNTKQHLQEKDFKHKIIMEYLFKLSLILLKKFLERILLEEIIHKYLQSKFFFIKSNFFLKELLND